MEIDWQVGPASEWRADALIFFGLEEATEPLPGFKRWLDQHGQWLSASPVLRDFQGKYQEVAVCYGPTEANIPRVVMAGLGTREKFDMERLQGSAAAALNRCRELRLARPAFCLRSFYGLPLMVDSALKEALIGGLTGLHRYEELKTRDIAPSAAPSRLVVLNEYEPTPELRALPGAAEATAAGICLARDLVSSPANRATPTFLADCARRLADRDGCRIEVIGLEKAESMGMGGFAAVARGSRQPACMIVLERFPEADRRESPIVFIGKGITFDTGGISLKPRDHLEEMKQDMAGAAAVLGAFETLGRLGSDRHVVGIMPCTENMPGGNAYKPGDVIRTMSGLTVEVISTDAEGRMVLCDALTYAMRYKPAAVFDIATLTAAVIIALGQRVAAVMANRDILAEAVVDIGAQVGERLWPLPLYDLYFDYLKSDVADFKNVGDRTAGSIVGGMFLKQFVPDTTPWAHLDIAGTAWTDKDLGATPRGGTGFGVRTLTELALQWPDLGIR